MKKLLLLSIFFLFMSGTYCSAENNWHKVGTYKDVTVYMDEDSTRHVLVDGYDVYKVRIKRTYENAIQFHDPTKYMIDNVWIMKDKMMWKAVLSTDFDANDKEVKHEMNDVWEDTNKDYGEIILNTVLKIASKTN